MATTTTKYDNYWQAFEDLVSGQNSESTTSEKLETIKRIFIKEMKKKELFEKFMIKHVFISAQGGWIRPWNKEEYDALMELYD